MPIDRKVLLRWLVIPVVAAFVFGYCVGMVLEMVAPDRSEKTLFNNAEEASGKAKNQMKTIVTGLLRRWASIPILSQSEYLQQLARTHPMGIC